MIPEVRHILRSQSLIRVTKSKAPRWFARAEIDTEED
jgi:hypothetical protein